MSSALRLAISLVLSLLLWLCMLPAALTANAAPEEIALRYLAALLLARVGVGIVFRIVSGYATQVLAAAETDRSSEPASAEAADEEIAPYGRRRTDHRPPEADLTDEQLLDEALDDAHDAATLVPEPAA